MKITYIHHSAFLVETEGAYLLFDYTEGNVPRLSGDKPLVIFVSHRHGDHYAPVIFEIGKVHGNVRYVLSDDIWRNRLPSEVLPVTDSLRAGTVKDYEIRGAAVLPAERDKPAKAGDDFSPFMRVTAYKSTDEGVAFLVEIEGKTIYHAGDLNNWRWEGEPKSWNDAMEKKYTAQVDKLAGKHLDVAFLPLDPRQEGDFYLGMDEFLRKVEADRVFPMHCWGDFSVIGRLKEMDCSAGYRERIMDIRRAGEEFRI